MNDPQKNQRIKVLRSIRGYEVGKSYVITRVDSTDNTLIAVDADGKEGSWLKWDDCVITGDEISWAWLKGQLNGETLELLSAFDGVEGLRLKDELRDHILIQLPNLKDRILRSQIQIEEERGPVGVACGGPFESETDEKSPF
jgi:hypothetical protein